MPIIELRIILDVPDGTTVNLVGADAVSGDSEAGEPTSLAKVLAAIGEHVPSAYRSWVQLYVDRCTELGCNIQPGGGGRTDYFNIYPPSRCRQVRVAGVTYSSSRTAVYVGDIALEGYSRAQPTYNSGRYAYPKLPHLDSADAVEEAVALTKLAIERTER